MSFSSISSSFISACGNPSSIVPLGIKDTINAVGSIATSNNAGGQIEAKDRAIDEFGTQFIWLFGLPICKKVFDKTVYKLAKQDPGVDIRLFTKAPKEVLKFAVENAPNDAVKKSIEAAKNNEKKFKALFGAKFVFATIATALMYKATASLRNLITKYNVAKKIKEQSEHTGTKSETPNGQVSFQGGITHAIQDFALDPVKNMMLIDGAITASRLTESRNRSEFLEFALSEGSFWVFMYGLNTPVLNGLQKASDKWGHLPINLDIRVLNSKDFVQGIKDGNLEKDIKAFNAVTKTLTDIDLVKKAVKEGKLEDFIKNNPENNLIKSLKDKSVKKVDENAFKKFMQKHKGLDKIDLTKYLNISADELKTLEANAEVDVLKFLKEKPDNLLVKFAKNTDLVSNFMESKSLKEKFKHIFRPESSSSESFFERVKTAFKRTDTGKLDTTQFIDTKELRTLSDDLNDYYTKCQKNGTSDNLVDSFVKKSKRNKIGVVMSTMVLSCVVLGFVVPHFRIWLREKMQGSKEFHVANDYQKQLQA